jgi:hypothetical protein
MKQPVNIITQVPVKQRTAIIFSEQAKGKSERKATGRGYGYTASLIAVSENIRAKKASVESVIGGYGIRPIISGKTTQYGQPINSIISNRGRKK